MNLHKTLKQFMDLTGVETELANILSSEILAEINREVVRTIYTNAEKVVANTQLIQLLKAYLTLIQILTVVGVLKDSKVLCSK